MLSAAVCHLLLLALLICNLRAPSVSTQPLDFVRINASLCITSEFIRTVQPELKDRAGEIWCATQCSRDPRCQAFTLEDGPCQLFVFDKCSKRVKDCGCKRRGNVFVKQQTGLPAGTLCPSDFRDDLCGVKYWKHVGGSTITFSWSDGKSKCESKGGLVIMADVYDSAEMSHIAQLGDRWDRNLYLGGRQASDGAEPSGGWSWEHCGLPLNHSLWVSGEPSNNEGADYIGRFKGEDGLNDVTRDSLNFKAVLCECVSPFN